MCVLNFFQGYFEFNPKAEVNFNIDSVSNFISTSKWDQVSFKYSLNTSIYLIIRRYVEPLYLEC